MVGACVVGAVVPTPEPPLPKPPQKKKKVQGAVVVVARVVVVAAVLDELELELVGLVDVVVGPPPPPVGPIAATAAGRFSRGNDRLIRRSKIDTPDEVSAARS